MVSDLQTLFRELKRIVQPYERGSLRSKRDEDGYYDLWSNHTVIIADRPRKEVFFASIITQKNHVGFYFMPVYSDEDILQFYPKELLACKKGASCFHIRRWDEVLFKQIEEALQKGYELYVSRGWIVP